MVHNVLKIFEEEGVNVIGSAPALAIEHALSLLTSELGDAVRGDLGVEDLGARLDRLEAFALLAAARLENLESSG